MTLNYFYKTHPQTKTGINFSVFLFKKLAQLNNKLYIYKKISMTTLNLQRLHEICSILSKKQDKLAEDDKYIYPLGNRSNHHCDMSFKFFLAYYSFKVEDDNIIVFNDDPVPHENYSNGDFSYIPTVLLTFDDEQLDEWVDNKIKEELKQQEIEKAEQKKSLELQIERLQTQLNNL